MRQILCTILATGILFSAGCEKKPAEPLSADELQGTITISGAWALYPMAVKWAEEFQKIHPWVKIDIAAGGAGKGMVDCLAEAVDLGMVSRDIFPEEIKKGACWFSVVKDAVVPTTNASNPVLPDILSRGIKKQTFLDIWITGKTKSWGEVIGRDIDQPISVYTRSDACGAAETWAKFLGAKQEDLRGVGVYGDPGLAQAVKQDVRGIGFNNINYAYDTATKKPLAGLVVLPIDWNENGRIDPQEDFYDNRDKLVGAISQGQYPSPPARLLHFVSQGNPKKKIVREFIKWVLTDGQKYVPESGYINLSAEKIREELAKLQEK